MADSAAFEAACDTVEKRTSLDRLEARGTVRIVLKRSGLDGKSVTPSQLRAVAEQVLAHELEQRGVEDAAAVCAAVATALQSVPEGGADASPEAVFERLGGSS